MKTKDRVDVAWIDPGQVEGAFALSLIELLRRRPTRIGNIIRIEGGLLSRQRNEVVVAFLDTSDSEWLLMLDSDEQLPVAAFDKLVNAAHAERRPVVGGLYFGTWPSGGMMPHPIPHLYRTAPDGLAQTPVVDYPADQLITVDALGTGCILIHRSVLEAIRTESEPHEDGRWCWFRDLPVNGQWVGEDIYFCQRIRALGYPIHAHTGAVLQHRRRYWLDDRQFEGIRSTAGFRAGQRTTTDRTPTQRRG